MYETRLHLEEGDILTLVEMASNVALTGWDKPDIELRLRDGAAEHLTVEQTEAGPAVSARVGCEIRLPATLPVKIREVKANLKAVGVTDLAAEQVRGSLRLSDVDGASVAEVYGNLRADSMSSLSVVGTVFGDAMLKDVESADLQNIRGNLQARVDHLRVSRVGGNLQAKGLGGALEADQVGGNALLKGVAGMVSLDQVAGNLTGKNLTGGAKVPKIGGNLVLNGELGAGCNYHLNARGNAMLRLSEGTNAHLSLRAQGKLMSSAVLANQEQREGMLTGTLGDGGTEIVVEAKGNVILGAKGQPGGGTDLGDEISRQVEESLRAIDFEAIGRQVSEEMDAAMSRLQVKLESVDWERLGLQTQQSVERAMEQMRRNMDRMVEKAARHQERLERRAEREAHRAERMTHKAERMTPGPGPSTEETDGQEGVPDGPSMAYPDPEEERLSILKMVEQGQITPQEAEMLLDALE
jgi:hypothetical protein